MMKLNIYSPLCLNLYKNIKYRFNNNNIRQITNILRINNNNINKLNNISYYNSRFYSNHDTNKDINNKLNEDSNEKTTENEENNVKNEKLVTEEDVKNENETLKQKLTTLETKLKELELKYKMCLSNSDNMCKIHKKELDNTKIYAVTEFAKSLLEVADTFELAFKHLNETDLKNTGNDFVDGIKMTESMLHQTFEKFGIKKYDSLMEDFNPQVHEAMFEVKNQDTHNKVIQVVKNGYMIRDRILRPAKVGVSKK